MCVVESRSDGAVRDPEDLRDLGRLVARVVAQHQQRPLLGRQSPEGAVELVALGDPEVLIPPDGDVNRQLDEAGHVPSHPLRVGDAGMNDEPVEPGIEAIGIPQGREISPGRHERLLDRVLRPVDVAQDALGDREQAPHPRAQELRVRPTVAVASRLDKVAIHGPPAAGVQRGRHSRRYGCRQVIRVQSRHHSWMPDLDHALAALDDRFRRLRDEAHIPGVAWGVVAGGALVHTGGAGTIRDGEDQRPDADSVYRIASMTKSFTAATLILLRDEGRLGLDVPVARYVPELAGWRPTTADSPPITVRQLMTMSGGLPTDDPWGDRQQGLDLGRFAALLAAGPSFAWPPGVTFEYSNLGYGILGRVITNVAGREYREMVRDRLLVPLGMTSTAYLDTDVAQADLAHGYVRRDEAYVREGTDGYGALASMGGVFSTVRDLSRWVLEFLDAFPARDDPEGDHPLRRSSRREMQQVQRAIGPMVLAHAPDAEPSFTAGGYGFGLFVGQDPELGSIISHAGGYPGFGTHMAWHPATGLGVIGLGNLRYAPVRPVVKEVLEDLVRAKVAPRRRIIVMPAVDRFRPVAEQLINVWDDALADTSFAGNMDLDEPREIRRASVAKVREQLGPFRRDETRPTTSDSPADVAWWLRGANGWLRVSILVSPEPTPRLQRLALRPVGDPSAEIRSLAERVVALTGAQDPAWPADLPLGEGQDREALERAVRAAGPRLGVLRLSDPIDGDGRTTSTFELHGERGMAELKLTLEPGTAALSTVSLQLPQRNPLPEAW